MVVAYLRGLLPRNHRYGSRSCVTEEIILESLGADAMIKTMEARAMAELALIPVLKPKAITKTMDEVSSRLTRMAELRLLDIYKVADQLATSLKVENRQNELSLFQLYQLAEKSGIFEAFDEHYTVENSRPLL